MLYGIASALTFLPCALLLPGRYLHWDHHKYNKEHTLSPFAGLAFHPLDGILQVRGCIVWGGRLGEYVAGLACTTVPETACAWCCYL